MYRKPSYRSTVSLNYRWERLSKPAATMISLLFAGYALILAGCPTSSLDSSTERIAPNHESTYATGLKGFEPAPKDDLQRLYSRINDVLAANREYRLLATDAQGAWQILHGILAYGRQYSILTSSGKQNALDYVLRGGAIKGFELRLGDRFPKSAAEKNGEAASMARGIRSVLDPGTKLGEGHRDQWLAYLSACNLQPDQRLQTIDGPSTIALWLRQMEWDVPLNFEREYSWTLMSMVPFCSTNHQWTARDKNRYSIESLLQSEMDMLSPQSACGGSHRLTAIAITLQKRQREGLPITQGTWADAQSLLETAIEEAFLTQNSDGSFSAHYFERGGWTKELVTAIGTTGHTLEMIAVAAPNELLTTQACAAAANRLCEMLEQSIDYDLECGALYHALSGLKIYQARISEANALIAST